MFCWRTSIGAFLFLSVYLTITQHVRAWKAKDDKRIVAAALPQCQMSCPISCRVPRPVTPAATPSLDDTRNNTAQQHYNHTGDSELHCPWPVTPAACGGEVSNETARMNRQVKAKLPWNDTTEAVDANSLQKSGADYWLPGNGSHVIRVPTEKAEKKLMVNLQKASLLQL